MTRLMLLIRVAAVFGLVFALSQCTPPSTAITSSASVHSASSTAGLAAQASSDTGEKDGTVNNGPTLPPPDPPLAASMASTAYRIGPRDSLQITVYQVPDLSSKGVIVGADGNIAMPLIGTVHVAGLTIEDAGKAIAAKLGKTYLQNPQVFVVLQESAKRIIVSGAVAKPTAIPPTGELTLSQAVVAAGGLSDVANGERVHIARVSGHKVRDAVYNLDAILAGKTKDPNVYGGDMIVAESSAGQVAFKNIKDLLPFTTLAGLLAGAF